MDEKRKKTKIRRFSRTECSGMDTENAKMIEKKVLTKDEGCGILTSLERETPSTDP